MCLMRKSIILFAFLLLTNTVLIAQNSVALWPIKGKKAGENILYKPGDYIGSYKLFDELILAAPEGTPVLAPVDGTIVFLSYGYYNGALNRSTSTHLTTIPTTNIAEFDRQERKRIAEAGGINDQFISITLGISCGPGEHYWVSGLRPVELFKTGHIIKKGDVIGYVGYCYEPIPEPCILLRRSINTKSADPMSTFGIISSFIPPKPVEIKSEISVSEQTADFDVFRQAMEEGHPGLYDYTTHSDMDSTFVRVRRTISQTTSPSKFRDLLQPILDSLRDCHTLLLNVSGQTNEQSEQKYFELPVRFGFQNDSLFIFQTFPEYQHLLHKQIVKINDENATTLLHNTKFRAYYQEGFNPERIIFSRLWAFQNLYRNSHNYKTGDAVKLEFSDGTNVNLNYIEFKGSEEYVPKRVRIKDSNNYTFELKSIDSKTAYLRIRTFALSETDEDSLCTVIKGLTHSSYQNLIIDVRDNFGGNESYRRLFALLAEKPFRTRISSMVKSNGRYAFLKNAPSYCAFDTVKLFPDFKKIEGKDGFYDVSDEIFVPNDSIHFGGKLFVLVDENSISSATLFPALVHKYKRGVIIGRETGTCYYQMNSNKFVTVRLPNSMLDLHMPLIKDIFENQIDPSIPWGHGVIPDHHIVHTFQEFLYKEDPILDYTLNLINQ